MTAAEALEYGLIDEVLNEPEKDGKGDKGKKDKGKK